MSAERCGATLEFGDDYGDNSSTFRCQLPEDHEGRHVEAGNMYGKCPYRLEWDGDMRPHCDDCCVLLPEDEEAVPVQLYHGDKLVGYKVHTCAKCREALFKTGWGV